ncbi:class I SAM-dependent methyltransferase [Treponema pedis]|uniref:class I SAM-dependent methyltransferase n=1 Tax=Treponema pedis TaxID=409322 RepID=UPI00197E9FAD|nr:class I SAM-dependent methyltransferase [Treponema pedis]QSI04102.1 class I SAM-dependent methyltransferase [Treponema pedis]
MYDIIAKNYSEIFPLDNGFSESIYKYYQEKNIKPQNIRILDVGCAVGDLSLKLSGYGFNIVGIDLSESMLAIAKSKICGQSNLKFEKLNMLDIQKLGKFDIVICFGNTVSHLKNEKEIEDFFIAVYNILNADGIFYFEALNYGEILNEKTAYFPVIETENFIFNRSYNYYKKNIVSFEIKFKDKKLNKTYSDLINLFPITKEMILNFLKRAGFSKIKYIANNIEKKTFMEEFNINYEAIK